MPPKKSKVSIYDTYFEITKESIQKYGDKTILYYQVGAFFEMYGIQHPTTKIISKSNVENFTQIAQLNMSAKEIQTPDGDVLMAGFRDYSLDKYLKIATQQGYTAVVYVQNTSNPIEITRDFYGVYSPGTFISFDTDSSLQLSNHTVCIWMSTYTPLRSTTPQFVCGLSSAHIFTGESSLFEYQTPFVFNPTTFDELDRFVSILCPSEVILISFLSDKETQQIATSIKTDTLHIIAMHSESNLEKKSIIEKCQKQTFIQHMLSSVFGTEINKLSCFT